MSARYAQNSPLCSPTLFSLVPKGFRDNKNPVDTELFELVQVQDPYTFNFDACFANTSVLKKSRSEKKWFTLRTHISKHVAFEHTYKVELSSPAQMTPIENSPGCERFEHVSPSTEQSNHQVESIARTLQNCNFKHKSSHEHNYLPVLATLQNSSILQSGRPEAGSLALFRGDEENSLRASSSGHRCLYAHQRHMRLHQRDQRDQCSRCSAVAHYHAFSDRHTCTRKKADQLATDQTSTMKATREV